MCGGNGANECVFSGRDPLGRHECRTLRDTTDNVLISDSIDYREMKTYQESFLCAEAPEWRHVRGRKRNALLERLVMRVVPTPPCLD